MLPFPVIMGPTASGKSALALACARAFSGEIISADSMQVYRGLDIGTAKPSPDEQREIPHHLVDIIDPEERFDLFSFRDRTEELITEIRSRGRLPILAGGTGLYIRAVVYGLDNMPADRELRRKLDAEFDNPEGFGRLKEIMRKLAPDDYEKSSMHCRRLIRSYEINLLTGKSMCELQKTWKKAGPRRDAVQFVLQWDREVLKERIRRRCEIMLESGWIEETRRLRERGLFSAPTAWQALGYPLVRDFLDGLIPRRELADRIATATWQFARKQLTWFRGQHPEALPLDMRKSESELVSEIKSVLERNA